MKFQFLPVIFFCISLLFCGCSAFSENIQIPQEKIQNLESQMTGFGSSVDYSESNGIAKCIKSRLLHMNANPSRVRFKVASGNDIYTAVTQISGHVPQAQVGATVAAAVIGLGFEMSDKPPPGSDTFFSVQTIITGFTPLKNSDSSNLDADFLALSGGKKRSIVTGDVSARSLVFRREGESWVSMVTFGATLPFVMDKTTGTIAVGLRSGVSGGGGFERVNVSSVSDATTLAATLATQGAISRAFGFRCA